VIILGVENKMKIIKLIEVDSTNEYTKRLYAESSIQHGAVVIAKQQIKGKGQRGKSWKSKKGDNLLFTYFSDADLTFSKEQFSFAVSVAVCKLICKYIDNKKVSIKWPNDILVDGEKIAGILIENRIKGGVVVASFVGVGLNVNQVQFPRFTRGACSLKSLNDCDYDVDKIAFELRECLINSFNTASAVVKANYLGSLYQIGQSIPFLQGGKQLRYTIVNVNSDGQLVVMNEEQETLVFDQGDLKYLK
jgi:BirA family biotin operon repressor/biotin-[acetyl-CoA-carboxylase] ligase